MAVLLKPIHMIVDHKNKHWNLPYGELCVLLRDMVLSFRLIQLRQINTVSSNLHAPVS